MGFYQLKENIEALSLNNDTGADLAQGDFSVLGLIPVIANEAIADGANGPCDVQSYKVIRTDELHATQNTFGTENQPVYWDTATLKFSDTSTSGYYLVGQLTKLKGSDTYIEFTVFPKAELIP